MKNLISFANPQVVNDNQIVITMTEEILTASRMNYLRDALYSDTEYIGEKESLIEEMHKAADLPFEHFEHVDREVNFHLSSSFEDADPNVVLMIEVIIYPTCDRITLSEFASELSDYDNRLQNALEYMVRKLNCKFKPGRILELVNQVRQLAS